LNRALTALCLAGGPSIPATAETIERPAVHVRYNWYGVNAEDVAETIRRQQDQ